MTSGEEKSREVDTAVEDLRRYKAHLSEIARYELLNVYVLGCRLPVVNVVVLFPEESGNI